MSKLKELLTSTQSGTVFVALTLILTFGIVVSVRAALGLAFPAGYEPWLIFLGTLAGVTTVGMVGKRATEKPEVIRAEGDAKAAVVAAQTSGQFAVPVAAADPVVALTHRESERGDG